jgi:hypothetical protein
LLLGLGESTELEMVQPHLSDLKVRLISGSAALHVVSNAYLDGLSVHSGNALVRFDKLGVYRLDAPAGELLRLKVFDGKAVVSANGSKHKVKKKWSLALAEPDSEPIDGPSRIVNPPSRNSIARRRTHSISGKVRGSRRLKRPSAARREPLVTT